MVSTLVLSIKYIVVLDRDQKCYKIWIWISQICQIVAPACFGLSYQWRASQHNQ